MMRTMAVLAMAMAMTILGAGCGKKRASPDPHGKDGGATVAAPPGATVEMVRELVGGKVPWARYVDPAAGVVELRGTEVARRCGAALDQALAALAKEADTALAMSTLNEIECDNEGLTVTVPGVASHAVCTIASREPDGDDLDWDLVFVPDPARGLRLIGVSTLTVDSADEAALDRFDEELGRFGATCP